MWVFLIKSEGFVSKKCPIGKDKKCFRDRDFEVDFLMGFLD